MNNDKPVTIKDLSNLLAPFSEAIGRIDKSLWLIAQLQLAAEFEPDQAKRQEHYEKLDTTEVAHRTAREALTAAQANKPDNLPDVSHSELVKLVGEEKADLAYKHVTDAMALLTITSRERTAACEAAPVLTRLHEAWMK